MARYKELEDYHRFTGPAESHKAINSFLGILEGIAIDAVVDLQEHEEIKNWYELYRHLIDRHPFNEILPAIDQALSDNILSYDEVQDLLWLCQQVSSGTYYNLVTSSIQTLHGVIHGILANNTISDQEIQQLQYWLEDHSVMRGTYPFDEIYSLVSFILEDGIISDGDKAALKAFLSEFVNTRDSHNLNENELQLLREQYSITGVCAKDPVIEIPGHMFCFTGASCRGTRDQIADEILARGGLFSNSVTNKTEYLVVGTEGNPCWAFSCYGRKVEKAIALRKDGKFLQIINEHDFWNALDMEINV